jgi:hypothetical protein
MIGHKSGTPGFPKMREKPGEDTPSLYFPQNPHKQRLRLVSTQVIQRKFLQRKDLHVNYSAD